MGFGDRFKKLLGKDKREDMSVKSQEMKIGHKGEGLASGRLIVVSALEGRRDYYERYLSLWDENDPYCHIVFLGNLIYSIGDDDGSVEILDDAIEKSKKHKNFHYLLGINELSCIMDENIYKMGINLTANFKNLISHKKGSLEPHLSQYANFFKTLPYYIKTSNGLYISYAGPLNAIVLNDLNFLRDFLWARQKGEDDGCKHLDAVGMKFMVAGNRPCDEGYDVFSRQLVLSSGALSKNNAYLDIDLDDDINSIDDLVGFVKSIGDVDNESLNINPIEGESFQEEIADVSEQIRNFKYLDDLIHCGTKEIVLDSDIILTEGEESNYQYGIELDVDDLVIDGAGYAIDACAKTRIFKCSGKNILFKDITFKNGSSVDGSAINNHPGGDIVLENCVFSGNISLEDGGAIINRGKISCEDVNFSNNSANEDGGAVNNQGTGELVFEDCDFEKNNSQNGGTIVNFGKLNCRRVNFSNSSAKGYGGAVNNQGTGELVFEDCVFEENISQKGGGAIINFGKIDFEKVRFSNNLSNKDGGAINNQPSGDLIFSNCNFNENNAENGGAIDNLGKIDFKEVRFSNNVSIASGAVSNQTAGVLTLSNCTFSDNVAKKLGGAIGNFGKIDFEDVRFFNNNAKELGGAIINSDEGILTFSNCDFNGNNAQHFGGAILNLGKIDFGEVRFFNNVSKESGGAINNQRNGVLTLSNCDFRDNNARGYGGAIINLGKFRANNTKFIKNTSNIGGAIHVLLGSEVYCLDCEFEDNSCENFKSIICNEGEDVKFVKCIFSKHQNGNVVFNNNNLILINCIFKNNDVDSVILCDEGSVLDLSGGKIADNSTKFSIHSRAQNLTVSNTSFENNASKSHLYYDIFNEGNLTLQAPKFKTNAHSILNKNHVDVKKLPHSEVIRLIKNIDGGSIDEFVVPEEYKYDFSHLNNLIQENTDGTIILENDISLENYELDFFEGGIEITKDNLILEGNNHIIDAKNRTRIFQILAENITIKNLIFKNGYVSNKYGEHLSGGGAIKTIKNSSSTLENCQFIDNVSYDDGGAIQNNGVLCSRNNKFINNQSEYCGGAIYNNNILHITNDSFKENKAKIAGSIYNNEKLTIDEDINLLNNKSDFKQSIYNANIINLENEHISPKEIIYNTGTVNKIETGSCESFKYISHKLKNSNEIMLQNDVKLEYIDIDVDEIVISGGLFDGNNHIIDLNNLNINFKIINEIIFRNVIFKNADIHKNSLFEIKSKVRFENVMFLNNKIATGCNLIENINADVEVINSNFYNNSSKNRSLINNTGELTVIESKFINNKSQAQGTIITHDEVNMKISIKNSEFVSNSSEEIGGVLSVNGPIEVSNSKFINNNSKIRGGAIFNASMDSKLFNCILIGNNANYEGAGAIYNFGNLDVVGGLFKNNTSPLDGGAIINLGKIDCEEVNFFNNVSKRNGGVINNQQTGVLTFTKCTFSDNIAQFGGAIFTVNEDAVKFNDCTFKDNNPSDVNKDFKL